MIADEETKKLVEENRLLKARLSALEAVPQQEPVGEQAEYLAIKNIYISSQDWFIDEGGVFTWTGIPNDAMEPRNDAARRAMRTYQEMQPKGITPDISDITEAACMLRPKDGESLKGETQAEWNARVMKLARDRAYARHGLKPEDHVAEMPHKIDDIPVIGNDPRVAEAKRRSSKDIARELPQPPARKKATKITGANNENPVFGS